MTAGFPEAANRLTTSSSRVGSRALEIAVASDPTIQERLGEVGLRQLLRDTQIYIDRLALSMASADPAFAREWATEVVPIYRRRQVPMDDLIVLSEALRRASQIVVAPGERAPLDGAIDAAIDVFRHHRRIGGDARKRNRILRFLYKGA